MIEELSVRMGVPEPRLTRSQTEMWVTRLTAVRHCGPMLPQSLYIFVPTT